MPGFKRLEGLSCLPLEDQTALSQFGQGPSRLVPYLRVHEAFEAVVDAYPESIAARFEQVTLTYQELDIAANRLANYLLASGLQPKKRVCLVVQRSLEMLIGIFAILKSGCQYVPIDGGVASDKQLAHILNDTAARDILCLPKFQSRIERFSNSDARITLLNLDVPFASSIERPLVTCSPADGCYAIYTSGRYHC